jgi:GntR family transcriptional regulator
VPSERELSEQFAVSRMTARQALTELANEGVLRREQGRGTFVAEPKLEQRLTRLTGFSEDMHRRGLISGARVLQLTQIAATPLVATALHLEPGAPVMLLERLRLAQGQPMAIEASHLHFSGYQELLQQEFTDTSLYSLLAHSHDILPTRAEQQVEASICQPRERELLGLPAGAPVLRNRRITYDQHDHPFEYAISVYRGDRYILYVELSTTV